MSRMSGGLQPCCIFLHETMLTICNRSACRRRGGSRIPHPCLPQRATHRIAPLPVLSAQHSQALQINTRAQGIAPTTHGPLGKVMGEECRAARPNGKTTPRLPIHPFLPRRLPEIPLHHLGLLPPYLDMSARRAACRPARRRWQMGLRHERVRVTPCIRINRQHR